MANVTATCGHTIDWTQTTQGAVFVKGYDKNGNHSVSYPVLCPDCLKNHEREHLILHTQAEKNEWLGIREGQRLVVEPA